MKVKEIYKDKNYTILVDNRQYIVKTKGMVGRKYFASLDDALEDILEHFTRKELSRTTRKRLETLIIDVQDIREAFWKKMETMNKKK